MSSSSENVVKLTKQQKRDQRRNANSMKQQDNGVHANATSVTKPGKKDLKRKSHDADESHDAHTNEPLLKKETSQDDTAAVVSGEKLTKQQKRDLKRKAQCEAAGTKTFVKKPSQQQQPKELIENSSVYRRPVVFPPEFTAYKGKKDVFVRPSDPHFNDIVSTSYSGLVVEGPEKFSSSFHDSFRAALEQLEKDNIYQFDLTQPTGLGTKVAKTFVTRCLVGDAGITYKYLGLRMFAHPWNEGELGATPAVVAIGRRNQDLIRHTTKLLKASGRENYGSCQFNLTLINRCYPEGEVVKLKEEPFFKKDKCTVSWHADSSLDHYSTIAVYHTTHEKSDTTAATATAVSDSADADEQPAAKKAKHSDGDKQKPLKIPKSAGKPSLWELALRVQHNAEGPHAGKPVGSMDANAATNTAADAGTTTSNVPLAESVTPSLAVPLPDRYSYFLLDDFNHHHQHSVLAGSTDRYASTHRVSRVEGHTYEYIKNKCQSALQLKCDMNIKTLRLEQLSLSEVEFEWIRQYYVQGSLHHELHTWWHTPMSVLMDLWFRLEQRTQIIIQALRDAALGVEAAQEGDSAESVGAGSSRKQVMKRIKYAECVTSSEVYEEMISFFTDRQAKRDGWTSRYQDPLYKKQPNNCQPSPIPFPTLPVMQYQEETPALRVGQGAGLPGLSEVVRKLEEWQQTFEKKASKK